jgi:hypothetical protein
MAINEPATIALFQGNNPLNSLKDESHYRKKVLPVVFKLVQSKIMTQIELAHRIGPIEILGRKSSTVSSSGRGY